MSKIDIFKYLFLFGKIKGINTDHMYFIQALIGIYLIFPVLYQSFKTADGRKCLMIFCICIFIFSYGINATDFVFTSIMKDNKISFSGLNEISLFGRHSNWLLFFILGAFIHNKRDEIGKIKGIRCISFLGIILSLTGLIFIKYTINSTFKWEGIYLVNGYGRLCTFIMSISTFIFIQNLSIKNKYIDKIINGIGGSTLGIYYMHIPILSLFNKYLYKLISVRGVTINLIKTTTVIFIAWGFIRIIKKIPFLKKVLI